MSDIILYRLAEARVFVIPNEPGNLVLGLKSGTDVTHYGMTVDELDGLAKRLTADVKLLQGDKGRQVS